MCSMRHVCTYVRKLRKFNKLFVSFYPISVTVYAYTCYTSRLQYTVNFMQYFRFGTTLKPQRSTPTNTFKARIGTLPCA